MDYLDAQEAAINEAIAEADVTPGDVENYTIEQLSEVVDTVASEIFTIETEMSWDEAAEEIKEEYIDRAVELVEDGKIVDTYKSPEIDIPAKSYSGELEHDSWNDEKQDYSSYVTHEEGEVSRSDMDYSDDEILEKKGYVELGDGLYISKEDYDENISEPEEKDPVCA